MHKQDSIIPTTPTVQVIERMFMLMDVLASREEAISLKEISEKTGLHPSTTHRLLNDLAFGRFVDRPQPGCYRLGMRLLELGNLVKNRLNVRDAALVPMRELHKMIQQPVNLSMRQGDEIVYIERAYSERSGMQVVRAIGGRAPLHLTSVGKLFLAADDPQRVRAYATRSASTAMRATTKSWNWVCAAWQQVFMTTKAHWWLVYQFLHQLADLKMNGYPSFKRLLAKFQHPWAINLTLTFNT